MLAELVEYSEKATLIMQSGVQFMDFGLTLDLRKETPGEFALQSSARSLARLEWDERRGRHAHPGNPAVPITPKLSMPVDDSCKLLDSAWLPIPVLRAGPNRAFDEGPTTWARARLVQLATGEDLRGHSHRLTLAFDTNVLEDTTHTAYLAPTREDIKTGASFVFTHRAHEMGWFTEIPVDSRMAGRGVPRPRRHAPQAAGRGPGRRGEAALPPRPLSQPPVGRR